MIDQLSPKQREAFIKTQPFLERGMSIIQATKKAKVKTSDFNNARARLTALKSANRNTSTLSASDVSRVKSIFNEFIRSLDKRARK